MRRTWLLVPAVLLGAFGPMPGPPAPAAPSGGRVALAASPPDALAAAADAASWECRLPHRDRPARFLGEAVEPPPLVIDASPDRPEPRPVPEFGTGPGQNPRGRLTGTLERPDSAHAFSFTLRAGEVFTATIREGTGLLEIRDPSGTLVQGSAVDRSDSYPSGSPLLGGGSATVDHVATVSGTHTVTVRPAPAPAGADSPPSATTRTPPPAPDARAQAPAGSSDPIASAPVPTSSSTPTVTAGAYRVDVGVFRPATPAAQRIVLEFGGATLDVRRFGIDTGNPRATLSPLSTYLAGWGLGPADEPALRAKITSTVRENLAATVGAGPVDVVDAGQAGGLTFGQPGVSRVVVGGSVQELGVPTVGLAESIDPGNFVREETALVVLDRLSGPRADRASLNRYLPDTVDVPTRVGFVGRTLGNVAAHEAGHLLGSWHTDPDSGKNDLMAPGDVVGAFGFGADEIGGTADDTRARFGQDRYAPDEGLTGTEDTKGRTMVGLDAVPAPNPG